MGYSIKWLIEERVIFIELFDVLTQSESRELSQKIMDHVVAGKAPVHIIVEMEKLLLSPSNIMFNQEVTAPYIQHPNLGWVFIINGNMVIKFVGSVLSRLTKLKLKHVDHYDEAFSLLKEIDASIDEQMIE